MPDTLSATFNNYSVLSSSSDKMTPFTLLSMKSGQQNIIIAFSILGVKLSPKSDKIMSLHVHREISNFKFAWILITKMDVEMSKAFRTPLFTKVSARVYVLSTSVTHFSPISSKFRYSSFNSNLRSIQAASFLWIFISKTERGLIVFSSPWL